MPKNDALATLTDKQQQAVIALSGGATYAEAALLAGCAVRTLHKWRSENEAFRTALKDMEGAILDGVASSLIQAGRDAVDVLQSIMNNASTPEHTRVAAAKAILENMLRLRDAIALEQRIRALEERLLNP